MCVMNEERLLQRMNIYFLCACVCMYILICMSVVHVCMPAYMVCSCTYVSCETMYIM